MTSFGRQFDFNDVTYHIGHCNVDTRRDDVVLTTFVRSKGVSAHDGFLLTHILYPLFSLEKRVY